MPKILCIDRKQLVKGFGVKAYNKELVDMVVFDICVFNGSPINPGSLNVRCAVCCNYRCRISVFWEKYNRWETIIENEVSLLYCFFFEHIKALDDGGQFW